MQLCMTYIYIQTPLLKISHTGNNFLLIAPQTYVKSKSLSDEWNIHWLKITSDLFYNCPTPENHKTEKDQFYMST